MGNRHPNSCSIRANSRTASREWPPIAKKSLWILTRSHASSSHHIAASVRSTGVRGSITSARSSYPAAYEARKARSILPDDVSGMSSSGTNIAGSMCSGSRDRRWSRSSDATTSARPAGTTNASSRLSPPPKSRTAAAQWATAGCRRSAASTSPSSMRKPRSLTWSSRRPRNSSSPSARHRHRSPVRYSRDPGSVANGCATNRSAVRSG